ncbi:hypothetical protein I4U23_006973 [Adineta vaga]|nr:hypothetical protein I4U23_006973 [Adineta vaga]
MASSNNGTSSLKKRHISFNHFLATKNLSIFRCKSPNIDNPNSISNISELYQSPTHLTKEQISLHKDWFQDYLSQPISLDLQLFKDLLIENEEYLIQEQLSPELNGRPFTSSSSKL